LRARASSSAKRTSLQSATGVWLLSRLLLITNFIIIIVARALLRRMIHCTLLYIRLCIVIIYYNNRARCIWRAKLPNTRHTKNGHVYVCKFFSVYARDYFIRNFSFRSTCRRVGVCVPSHWGISVVGFRARWKSLTVEHRRRQRYLCTIILFSHADSATVFSLTNIALFRCRGVRL